MFEYLILALAFAAVFALTLFGYQALVRRRERVGERLETPVSDPALLTDPNLVLGELTPAMAEQIPMSTEDREGLRKDLRSAGLYRPTALMEYSAVRAVLVIVPLIAGGIASLWWATTAAEAARVWMVALGLAMLGFSLPRVYLLLRARARRAEIERGLPTAIDMLTLCLSSGHNVQNSLQRTADALQMSYPTLAYEMQLVRRQSELRSLDFALSQFADRIDVPSLRNLSMILTQSEKLGTDAATVLREYSDNLLFSMKQNAEAAANRGPFKMFIPGFMIAIGFMMLVMIPPVMEMRSFLGDRDSIGIGQGERRALESLGQPQQDLYRARRRERVVNPEAAAPASTSDLPGP